MSFSPVVRVRKLLDKMKSDRVGGDRSPRLHNKRFHRTSSEDFTNSQTYSPNTRPKKTSKFTSKNFALELKSKEEYFLGEDQFQKLPAEATLIIFSFLEKEDFQFVRLVSKYFFALSEDESIWKSLCQNDWNIQNLYGKTWKHTYLRLEELFADGIWEGMSKWVDPAGFENEQKTTARLAFHKMKKPTSNLNSVAAVSSPVSSPSMGSREVHRSASAMDAVSSVIVPTQTIPTQPPVTTTTTTATNGVAPAIVIPTFTDSALKIMGTGVTVNCAAPSPFKIEGERLMSDSTGVSFQWNKQFERHTSVYTGKLDFIEGTVSGHISYHDGNTHWKGIFFYTKINRGLSAKKMNQVIA